MGGNSLNKGTLNIAQGLFFIRGVLFKVHIMAKLSEIGIGIPLTKKTASTFYVPFEKKKTIFQKIALKKRILKNRLFKYVS